MTIGAATKRPHFRSVIVDLLRHREKLQDAGRGIIEDSKAGSESDN
jgi:hypothetical protein